MKKSSLIKVLLCTGFIVVLGKGLGFLREAILAFHFGASSSTDAFYLAQSMPATLFPAVCNSFATALIPMYVQRSQLSETDANKFASRIIMFTSVLAIVLSILAIIFMRPAVGLIFPGLDAKSAVDTVSYSRVIMLAFVFTMIQYITTALLTARGKYYASQLSGLLYSIVVITATVYFGSKHGMMVIIISVSVAHFLQAMFLLFYSRNQISLVQKTWFDWSEIKELLVFTGPVLLSNLVYQINAIANKSISTGFGEGAISSLVYSQTIDNLVIGIFSIILTTVVYPVMANERKNEEKFRKLEFNGINYIVIILLPISLFISMYSEQIIQVIFMRGRFDESAMISTSGILRFGAWQYTFFAIRELLMRSYYAEHNTKAPLKNIVIGVAANVSLALLLSRLIGLPGIGMANAIAALISSFLLFVSRIKRAKKEYLQKFLVTAAKVSIALLLSFAAAVPINMIVKSMRPIVQIGLSFIVFTLAYLMVLLLLRCSEIMSLLEIIKRKAKKLER